MSATPNDPDFQQRPAPVPGQPPLAPPEFGRAPVLAGPAPVRRTRAGGLWVGLIAAAVLLVLLLVFILQNLQSARVHFLGASGTLPVAVALLLAAAVGALLIAIPGTVRIVQLRKSSKRGGDLHS